MANTGSEPFIKNLLRAWLRHEGAGLTDGQLLEEFVGKHDATAFEELVQRHGPMVWGTCHRILRNPHDSDDAFQATFLVLVQKAASVLPRQLVGNWLYGVAHVTALRAKAVAAKQRVRERQVIAMPEPIPRDEGLSPDLLALLDQELKTLPDRLRAAIVLCDLEGRSRREVARQLKIPEGTLSSRLTTGRRILARKLARHGIFSAAALATILSRNSGSATVPAPLVGSTVLAAIRVAAGQAVTSDIASAKVISLSQGVMKTMFLTKLKSVLAAVLVAAAVVTGTAVTGTGLVPSGRSHGLRGACRARTASAAPSSAHIASAADPLTDDVPKPGPIDSDTIAAYKKLGAVYGGFHENPNKLGIPLGWIEFKQGKEASAKSTCPDFALSRCPKADFQNDCRRLEFRSDSALSRQS